MSPDESPAVCLKCGGQWFFLRNWQRHDIGGKEVEGAVVLNMKGLPTGYTLGTAEHPTPPRCTDCGEPWLRPVEHRRNFTLIDGDSLTEE